MDRPTSVYIIECNGLVKIGVAVDPAKRLKTIQTGQPVRATIYASREFSCAKVAYAVENQLHRRFVRQRKVGEWFDLTPAAAKRALNGIKPLVPSGVKIRSDRAEAWLPCSDEEWIAAVNSLFSRSPLTTP